MTEIVNLRLARKRKARAEKEARASQNRIEFGRTKSERKHTQAEIDRASHELNSHKRDVDEGQDG